MRGRLWSPAPTVPLLKLTPDFRAWWVTERRERYERLKLELSWIKSVYDLRLSDAGTLTPSEGRKQREQIADTAEKLLRLLGKIDDWEFLNRAAKDQVKSWSAERQCFQRQIATLRKTERRTRKRVEDLASKKCAYFQMKLAKIEAATTKRRDEFQALDRKKVRLGRRLDNSHPEAEEAAANLVLQDVASDLKLLIPLLRDIIETDHETQIKADARRSVADQLRALARKYIRSGSHAATDGRPGPALRFAEAASFVIIPTVGIPWPAPLRDMAMPSNRAIEYRHKAQECRLKSEATKLSETKQSWWKLAAQWERLAQEIRPITPQAQQPQRKGAPDYSCDPAREFVRDTRG